MIECGSLEYAQARIGARHGERLREADWHRIEVLRELRPLLEFARSTALRPWLAGIDADSSVHRLEAALRDRWRTVVGEVASWMPARWRPALAWWSVLPDLAPLQHLARDEEPAAWMRDDDAWRELCASAPEARAARLAGGPLAALAAAWPAPETLAQVWQETGRGGLQPPFVFSALHPARWAGLRNNGPLGLKRSANGAQFLSPGPMPWVCVMAKIRRPEGPQ